MIPILTNDIQDGQTYYIEYYGPNGLISKRRGTANHDGSYLIRWTNILTYTGTKLPITWDWFHTSRTQHNDVNTAYYWKYYLPTEYNIKQKVHRADTKIILLKMLLLRQFYSTRIGDSSTIQGFAQLRFGL